LPVIKLFNAAYTGLMPVLARSATDPLAPPVIVTIPLAKELGTSVMDGFYVELFPEL
jgi:TRAP-type mannitol/chloroaromatic compound transport system permease large subunit